MIRVACAYVFGILLAVGWVLVTPWWLGWIAPVWAVLGALAWIDIIGMLAKSGIFPLPNQGVDG